MGNLDFLVLDLALILTVAGFVTIIFKKLNQPLVLGYIVAGFLISPNFTWLPTVVDEANIHIWGNIGIIFLMFALGLEFSFHKLAKIGGSAIITASVVMGAMIIIGYVTGILLGWSTMDSVFLGGMISMSSTMIILKAYEEMKLKKEKFASLVLGTLVFEDIAGIFMMIILATISVSQKFSGLELTGEIAKLLLILVAILCFGIYIVPSVFKKISGMMNDETLLIVSLGFCLIMVVIAVVSGFSEALGAFLAGTILAGTVQGDRIERLVKPIKDLFGAIFFISVGMLIVPKLLVEYIVPILLISVVTIIGQMIFSMIGAIASGQSLHTAVRVGFSMVQIGEFSFIVASLGTTLGVTSDFLYPIVVCVSVITTFTTPIFIKNGEKAYEMINKAFPEKWQAFIRKYTSDRQIDNAKDNDWKMFFKIYISKVIMGTATMFFIYMFGTQYLLPLFLKKISDDIFSRAILFVFLMVPMFPTINIMCNRKNILFNKLWLKNRTNIFPLLALRSICIAISAAFSILIINKIFAQIPLFIATIIAVSIILLCAKSGFIKGKSMTIETRFIANLNENILHKAKKESGKEKKIWVDEALYIVEFQLIKKEKREYIRDFLANKVFGVMIIKIVRKNGEHINFPKAEDALEEGDRLIAMGSKEQVETYFLQLCRSERTIEGKGSIRTLKEYIYAQIFDKVDPEDQILCCAVPINKNDGFARKPIEESGFVSKYGGIIVGVERDLLPIVSPDKNFVLKEGDIMWVIGNHKMADKLLKNGLLAK